MLLDWPKFPPSCGLLHSPVAAQVVDQMHLDGAELRLYPSVNSMATSDGEVCTVASAAGDEV